MRKRSNIYTSWIRLLETVIGGVKRHKNNQLFHVSDKDWERQTKEVGELSPKCCEDCRSVVNFTTVQFNLTVIIERDVNTRKVRINFVCPYCDENILVNKYEQGNF